MYKEIGEFIKNVGFDGRLYNDGEFWTAALIGVGIGFWIHCEPTWITAIRNHFADLLSVTSIVFGFVLTTLFFYIQAAGTWSEDDNVQEVASSLIDHHVWTVVSLLFLIGYVVFLWIFAKPTSWYAWPLTIGYSFLVFLICYCGFQILNQVLTIRWAFRRRHRLLPPSKGEK